MGDSIVRLRSWRTQHQPIVEVSEEGLEVVVAAATVVVAEVAAVDAVVAVVRRRRIGSL